MLRAVCSLCVLVLLVVSATADVYMHNPRGSNNRLNGENQNVDNNNRMCDTQNNDRGGYCWGPPLYYYVGSHLMIEWTNQHACNNPKVLCNIVLQYMCDDDGMIRDGSTTDTIPDNANEFNTVVDDPLEGRISPGLPPGQAYLYGMHENYQWYQDCKARERNKGLFTADQNMNNANQAINTRQDNNGNRNGFECNEERDYYPYWHPTPWKDIAVLVGDTDRCDFFQSESQNVKAKNYCSNPEYNNEIACTENNAVWETQEAWGIDEPDCRPAPWTRDNHLGNTLGGYASSYNWTIPNDVHESCVLRLRYNISTGDYENWGGDGYGEFVDFRFNGDDLSPVEQDEIVDYYNDPSRGAFGYELALNTDQTGRTFQDRSHTFAIRERPFYVPDAARVFNVNVRGKRGNIVQVYPAVEYDFVPNRLHTRVGDFVHFQWTGCDTNPANNDGEGTQQTDRSNVAQMVAQDPNYPENFPSEPMFDDEDTMFRMAFVDQSNCLTYEQLAEANNNNQNNIEQDVRNCMKLNGGPPYFDASIMRMNKTGIFHYFSTRNNNFSNRTQKGVLFVDSLLPVWALVLIALSTALLVAAAIVGGVMLYARSHPTSAFGRAMHRVEMV